MKPIECKPCKRKRIKLDDKGNNLYVIVSKDSVDVSFADENKPEMQKAKQIADIICKESTKLLKLLNAEQVKINLAQNTQIE